MFTGIVEVVGTVRFRTEAPGGITFRIEAPALARNLRAGDSVSISGACHTVEQADLETFAVTSVPETLRKTAMGDLRAGSRVNLEPAATMATALGGHIVQGHVDGTGTIVAFEPPDDRGERRLVVNLPPEVFDLTVPQGSIAIDGVSLTVAGRGDGHVHVAIIPFTLEHTTFDEFAPGRRVNVEADVIGKYVMQYMERLRVSPGPAGQGTADGFRTETRKS